MHKNMKNTIIQGDILEELKKMPNECVDMIITSPPYFGLRDYQVERQIGLEESFDEFLKKMLIITKEWKRVLKKSGTLWLNMGDCYCSQPAGNTKKHADEYAEKKGDGLYKRKGQQTEGAKSFLNRFAEDGKISKSHSGRGRGLSIPGGLSIPEKCMLMQPERLAIKMIDEQGWILRNKIKWAKQVLIKKENKTIGSVMPTSVKDRFNESGEELYFFVKSKKYYSDLDAVRMKNQVLGVTDFRPNRGGLLDIAELYKNSEYRDKSYHGKFTGKKDAEKYNSPRARTQRKTLKSRMDDTKDKNTKHSRSYNIKKMLSEVRLGIRPNTGMIPNKVNDPRGNHEGGPGSWRDFKDENENFTNLIGKNLPSIWQIGSEPHNFKKELGLDVEHFAIFPQALLEIPIKFGCPKGGIVLDPFMGSGTTAVMARKLGRNYLGIELSEDYIKIAKKRLAQQSLL